MGLDINAVQFLIDARKRGADFGEVLTLGRQDLNEGGNHSNYFHQAGRSLLP